MGKYCACTALIAMLVFPLQAQQPLPNPALEDGLVLLRNGHVIAGKITRSGDWYYVVLPDGEIRLKAAEVELSCRNIEEGYQRKRATVPVNSVEEHLRLAQWCQQQGLLEHMKTELADARRIDPKNPLIEVVLRRLESSLEARPPAAPAVAETSSAKFDELDRMVRTLPAGSVEKFTQTIQPLLMNNCTAGGCHGPSSEAQFRLQRITNNTPPSRRLTQQNLFETLQWVKQDQPEASPLLTYALRPHGKTKTAGFRDPQAAQYKRLVDWVMEVTGNRKAEVPAVADSRAKPQKQIAPSKQAAADKKTSAEKESTTKSVANPTPSAPADPFDPETFNRRYLEQQPSSSPE
jgi:hypothetical protein